VCTPPAGTAARSEVRATIGRLAHEPFTDEQVGELLEGARQRDDIEADRARRPARPRQGQSRAR
jgi:Zn-dependent M32 family carboxypeptidase